jgi:hypothetical protein
MRIVNKSVSLSLATIALSFSLPAMAEFSAEEAPDRSINSCVTEIGLHADYTDATRVRHELESTGRRSLAYELKFATRVIGNSNDDVIREYNTKCVVYGDEKPVHFEITQSDSEA